MKRRIINIDRDRCNGCGACVDACHEGAIGLVDGKATLLRDDYCDGLGDCLPSCPMDAISFVEREALEYNEMEVKKNMMMKKIKKEESTLEVNTHSCPGIKSQSISHEEDLSDAPRKMVKSRLQQWPCQIKLAPVNAPWFNGAKLLVAADCTAYAYANFHEDFIKGKICLVGCPKLDAIDYSEKLQEIIATNDIKSVEIVRMEVPCCGGLENAVKLALQRSGKFIPWQVVTIGINGDILD